MKPNDPPSPSVQTARFILYETRGRWTPPLRRALARSGIGMRVVQERHALSAELRRAPASLVGLECETNGLESTAQLILDVNGRWPRVRVAVLADRDLRGHTVWLRELGAIHVEHHPRRLAPFCRMIDRHLRRAPRRVATFTDEILSELPWSILQ